MSITSVKSGATGISLALDNNFMEPIATTLVGSGGVNTVIFNDIPQNYKHLQLRSIAQCSTNSSAWQRIVVAFNSDTTDANYTDHIVQGNGSSASAVAETSTRKGFGAAAQTGTSIFFANITDILDYTNTSKHKTSRTLRGMDNNGANATPVSLESSLWMSTFAISSITLTLEDNSKFNQHSRFSLYGIKG
jgi:hypothetical protein